MSPVLNGELSAHLPVVAALSCTIQNAFRNKYWLLYVSCDAYFVAELESTQLQSKKIVDNISPTWQENVKGNPICMVHDCKIQQPEGIVL